MKDPDLEGLHANQFRTSLKGTTISINWEQAPPQVEAEQGLQ